MKDGYKYFVMREEWHVMLRKPQEDGSHKETSLGCFPDQGSAFRFRDTCSKPHPTIEGDWVPIWPQLTGTIEVWRREERVS